MRNLRTYPVWDASVRWFHWINVLCVLVLTAVGVALLNDKALGFSRDGKVLLTTVHVWVGYVFALNLCWRLVWAFVGGTHARWREILPFHRGYFAALRRYVAALRAGKHPQYLGHNPLGRIAVSLLLLLLAVEAVTGIVLANDLVDSSAGALLVRIHEYAFYGLLLTGVLHIAAVVITEVRGGGNLVSAMFTGKKILRAPMSDQKKDASP